MVLKVKKEAVDDVVERLTQRWRTRERSGYMVCDSGAMHSSVERYRVGLVETSENARSSKGESHARSIIRCYVGGSAPIALYSYR